MPKLVFNITSMPEISLAAEAVLDAFRSSHTRQGCLAAALRALADQGEILFDMYGSPVEAITAEDLLTFAKELEAS